MMSTTVIPRQGGLNTFHSLGREVGRLASEMDRMFDDFFGTEYEPRSFRFRHGGGEWKPRCDISETDSDYHLRLEVPGFSKDQLHADVSENSVTLKGEIGKRDEHEGERYVCRESCFGSFERTFRFGSGIRAEGVKATLKDGILWLTLPKAQSEHFQRIEITEEN